MNEVIRYIFSKLRYSEMDMRRLSRYLKTQLSCIFFLVSVVTIQEIEMYIIRNRISLMQKEIDDLKKRKETKDPK